ncbi:DinB family protein [Neptunomonas antarctica]|uniref:Uncharacterized damage-inducible protein DinB (Forms a four-helix bundle) n=1 Tax=Neptunomonas antarctica TaxID=619304 RepID=A0A1N7NT69_9GAMM|nr:DinB family protein [Neptunomonas antarctica]SIT01517.1 Uncharacterized damage-inducible protein DinB (forms a four-helix bundle) [Neptunomonas antarctica]
MNVKDHFRLMAAYNRRLNEQLYQAAASLPEAELERDVGAFFKSIMGSLNHIVVGDLLWLSRFATHAESYQSLARLETYPKPGSLDERLFDDFNACWAVRKELDEIIQEWLLSEILEVDFDRDLIYKNSKGVASSRNFAELLFHFFNHQTHHRGQISTLLYQQGIDVGVTDFLIDIPDALREQ